MEKEIKERIFLVGCPRSGTTFLQSLIAAHPQVASFPETHFLVATGRTWRGRWCTRLGVASPEMKERLDQFLGEIGHDEMRVLLPRSNWLIRPYADALVRILDRLTLNQGKAVWLEKTPGHLHYVDLLERYIPGARFIHIVRNGPDVVASLYEITRKYPQHWGGAYSIDHCIDRWNQDVRLTQRYARRANHMLVRYEKLMKDLQVVLADVCDFIGVAFSQDMVTRRGLATKEVVLAHEAWKQENEHAIHQKYTRFEGVFSQSQRALIQERLAQIEL